MLNTPNQSITLRMLGKPILVSVRHSYRAKHIAIRVNKHKEAELVLPLGGVVDTAYKFLFKHEAWIRKKLVTIYKPTSRYEPEKILTILGKSYSIKYVDVPNKFSVTLDNNDITVYSLLTNTADVLSQYLKQHLLQEITISVKTLTKAHGFKRYGKISVREVSSRWGSCSQKGSLSFNWRLIFAPPKILNYVLVHEICHLKEMNHSTRFWDLVRNIDPNYKTSILWLKNNGKSLYQYLPYKK